MAARACEAGAIGRAFTGEESPGGGEAFEGGPIAGAPTRTEPQALPSSTKWSWACRHLLTDGLLFGQDRDDGAPRVGDLALVRVERIGYHNSIVASDHRKLRIYPGDLLVGVFGHRYATDAYEAEVRGTDSLGVLTAGGMVGTVLSRHRDMAAPTQVTFLGYVVDPAGQRVNLKEVGFRPTTAPEPTANVVVVVGTGMNAGKTTVVSQLVHALGRAGLKVAAGKLTGSVSNRDQEEMRSASAVRVLDFSDYGFPSTYLAPAEELAELGRAMLADLAQDRPDVIVLEIADGVLQRETALLLSDEAFRRRIRGVVLAADGALSGLYAVDRLRANGHRILAVSGALTSSPLYVREFRGHCSIPVASSTGDGAEIARAVTPCLAAVPTAPAAPSPTSVHEPARSESPFPGLPARGVPAVV
jgi:hypothetical protein